MTTAKAIHQRMRQAGHQKPAAILTIVSDDHNVHCLTEDHLDTWWASLDPVEKADVYEEHLESQVVAEDAPQPATHSAVHGARITIDQFAEKIAELTKAFPPIPQPSSKGDHHARQTM